jgi:hypothetical protein
MPTRHRNVMAVLLVMLCLFLLTPAVWGSISWHRANQVTIGWSTVIYDGDIQYEVYLTPANKHDPFSLGMVAETQVLLTIPQGRWYVGVAAVAFDDYGEFDRSIIAWSSDPVYVADGVTFGLFYSPGVDAPGKLKVQ